MPSGKYARKDVPRICAVCGTSFLANKYTVSMGQGRYCGNRCRVMAQRRRVVLPA